MLPRGDLIFDPHEPENVGKAVAKLGFVMVITSVDRDDLDDGGAQHFADTIPPFANCHPALQLRF